MTDDGAAVVAEREAPGAFFIAEAALGAEGTVKDLDERDDALMISRTAVRAGVIRNMVAIVLCATGEGWREQRKFLEQHEGVGGLRL